jgi:RNA polymerase sigma-70 factor, ECF subfamily
MENDEFGRLYQRQFDCVYRYSLALTGNPARAEEVTQEAFARLLRNGFENTIARPEAWLMRVARNLSVETLREGVRERTVVPSKGSRNPEQLLYANEVLKRVLCALGKLTQTQKECIALREFAGLSYQEIAEVMSTSIDQVKVQLFRARQHLKKELEDLT